MDASKTTVKLRHTAKDLGAEVSNLVMADLISIGYSESDAFTIAYPERVSVYSLQQIQSLREGIINSDAFQELVEKRRDLRKETRGRKPKLFNNDEIELIDTTTTAKELLRVINSLPENSKEKGQMLVAYSELMRKNSQQMDEEDDPVVIYLPLSCKRCTLYEDYIEKEKLNELSNPSTSSD